MSKEEKRERIQHLRDIKNNIWTALIVTIGGTVGLSLNPNSLYKLILLIVGIIFILIFLYGYFNQYDLIENLINKLDKEND